MKKIHGFTLLEVLIALFIFSILSIIMVSGLRTVIGAQSGTETSAERLRHWQMIMLQMSRDIEQTINRPIVEASGKQNVAFEGSPRGFTFTHMGKADNFAEKVMGAMERTRYFFAESKLQRMTWPVLDQAPQTKPHTRVLLSDVREVRFQYLDQTNRFKTDWPIEGETNQPLPKAVRVSITFSKWGTLSQLYVIPTQKSNPNEKKPPNFKF